MLNAEEIAEYVSNLTPEQVENVHFLRRLLQDSGDELVEEVCGGKWYTGLLTYKRSGSDYTVFALGPLAKGFTTFHMMPYYASADLQKSHGAALKPFLSGKSCLKFKRYADLPHESLQAIIKGGAETFEAAKAALTARDGRAVSR